MYEVSWALIGKKPESQGFYFENFEDARHFLEQEMWWSGRDSESNLVAQEFYRAGIVLKEAVTKEDEFIFTVDGVSYWLIKHGGEIDVDGILGM